MRPLPDVRSYAGSRLGQGSSSLTRTRGIPSRSDKPSLPAAAGLVSGSILWDARSTAVTFNLPAGSRARLGSGPPTAALARCQFQRGTCQPEPVPQRKFSLESPACHAADSEI
ncbi:hypothetical protein Dda_4458 [Drechslerella dactyloides]|uniref:Uncharacterized protein n=1 Tax=Drechslerella dactyloides TaxID=74499 RepID=A0AAD6IWZ3_DREDA|nr:hypothetical protein Dda_4458 [Drechslerella dactyloides]